MSFIHYNHKQFKQVGQETHDEIKKRFVEYSVLSNTTTLLNQSLGNTFFRGRQPAVSTQFGHQLSEWFARSLVVPTHRFDLSNLSIG